jgi:hypothetical protein
MQTAELTCPWCEHQAEISLGFQHRSGEVGLHCQHCGRYSGHKIAHEWFDIHQKKLEDEKEVWKRIPNTAYLTLRQHTVASGWIYTIYLGKGEPREFWSRDSVEHLLVKEFGMSWHQASSIITDAFITPGKKVYFQKLVKISSELDTAERKRVADKPVPPAYQLGDPVRVSGVDGLFLRYSDPGFAIVAFPQVGDAEVPVIEFEVIDTGDTPEEVGFEREELTPESAEEAGEAFEADVMVHQVEQVADAVETALQHEEHEGDEGEEGEIDALESAHEHLEEAVEELADFVSEEMDEAEHDFDGDDFEHEEEPEFEQDEKRAAAIPPLERTPHDNAFSGGWVVVDRATGKPVMETFEQATAARVDQTRYEVLTSGQWLARFNREVRDGRTAETRTFPHPKMCAGCGEKHRGMGAYCGSCKGERKAWWDKAPWEIRELDAPEQDADETPESVAEEKEDKDSWIEKASEDYPSTQGHPLKLPKTDVELDLDNDTKEANGNAQRRVHTHVSHSGDLRRAIAVNADDLSIRDIRDLLAFYRNVGRIDAGEAETLATTFIGNEGPKILTASDRRTAGDVIPFDQSRRRPTPSSSKNFVQVYHFPNGFQTQAQHIFRWLQNPGVGVQFHPAYKWIGGDVAIELPEEEVPALRRLQQQNPARWGNPTARRVAVAPPGREDQVKELKKDPGIDNPFAVAWSSYDKSHGKKPTHKAALDTDECVNCGAHGKCDERGRCAKCARGNTKEAVISGSPGSYHVKSEEGKNLGGPYKTREQATHRLKQVEYFKHKSDVKADTNSGFGSQPAMSGQTTESFSGDIKNGSRRTALLQRGLGIFQPALYRGKEVLVIAIANTGDRVTVRDNNGRMFSVDAADLSPTKTGPYSGFPR